MFAVFVRSSGAGRDGAKYFLQSVAGKIAHEMFLGFLCERMRLESAKRHETS